MLEMRPQPGARDFSLLFPWTSEVMSEIAQEMMYFGVTGFLLKTCNKFTCQPLKNHLKCVYFLMPTVPAGEH